MSAIAEKLRAIAERQQALEQEKVQLRATAIEEIRDQIAVLGLKPADVFDPAVLAPMCSSSDDARRRKVEPKYAYNGQTWTGRGRQPKWVQDIIAAGGKIEDYLIKKE